MSFDLEDLNGIRAMVARAGSIGMVKRVLYV
jgi:hypothetical protein